MHQVLIAILLENWYKFLISCACPLDPTFVFAQIYDSETFEWIPGRISDFDAARGFHRIILDRDPCAPPPALDTVLRPRSEIVTYC